MILMRQVRPQVVHIYIYNIRNKKIFCPPSPEYDHETSPLYIQFIIRQKYQENPWRKYRIPTLIGKYPGRKDLQCLPGKGRLCDMCCVVPETKSTLFYILGSCPRREIENYEKFMTLCCSHISYQFHRNKSPVCFAFQFTIWLLLCKVKCWMFLASPSLVYIPSIEKR